MKLNKLLPIVALTGIATVAMPLVSCNKGGDSPESIDFSIADRQTTSQTTATLSLDWTPSEDSVTFSNLTASSATVGIQTAKFVGESRPQQIDLTFEGPIVEDLDDVVIEFDYEDKTQKFTSHAKLENVCIDPYVLDIICDQIDTFTYEYSSGYTETYDVVQSTEASATGGKITTFGVNLNEYADAIQDTESLFFGVKRPFLDAWTLLGLDVENIGALHLGEVELTDISGSGSENTYWIEIKAPTGGWKAAISASTDGCLTGSYTFKIDYSKITLMFGQLQQPS